MKHVLWMSNLVIPQMAERRDGVVIIVSSIGGLKGHENLGIYALSKAAEMQLARNLAVEWGRSNIRVNCIAPGLVRTHFAKALWEDPLRLAEAVASYPLGRIGEPEDIAGAAVFLASRAGAWTTGQVDRRRRRCHDLVGAVYLIKARTCAPRRHGAGRRGPRECRRGCGAKPRLKV